ncbi:MAG: class I SAM-dependent methyltransferase [Chloroflexota bacterium]
MNNNQLESYQRFVERYKTDEVPWDDVLPPPEAIELLADLPPGRGLDLGCGYGRASIYLAQLGWTTDGIDFVPSAIAEANRRAAEAQVAERIRFHVGSVTELDFLEAGYDFALDVGCLHNFDEPQRIAYEAHLRRLLKPEAWYLLFAHMADLAAEQPRAKVDETAVRALFADYFTLERIERGVTEIPDMAPWRSAWFWFRRKK